ncbi:MAG: phosphatase PAP2 family protein [Dehalococcoidia bacterium]|nr:phosphatase PAP2 family protein [Dehalococcoidia bacterium]
MDRDPNAVIQKPERFGTRGAVVVEWIAKVAALLASLVLLFERSPRRTPLIFLAVVLIFLFLIWFSRQNRRNYGMWAIYVVTLLVFSMLRPYADETSIPVHVADLAQMEALLFGGTIPSVWLQHHFFDPRELGPLDWVTTHIHWSYFIMPHLMTILVFLFKPKDFDRQVLTIIGIFVVGLAIYFVAPAAPPWYAARVGEIPYLFRVMNDVGAELNAQFYSTGYRAFGESNAVAALPSLHMAVTFGLVLLARRYSNKLALGLFVYSLLMGFSLVYLGEHYVVDLLLGMGVAWVVYTLVDSYVEAREGRVQRAPPATGDKLSPGYVAS